MTYSTPYQTVNFTPTSEADSAYAWDRLADAVIGHATMPDTTPTPHDVAVKAFAALDGHDLLVLRDILDHVPALGTDHLHRAVAAAYKAHYDGLLDAARQT